jgi:hypothetical protein
LIDDWWKRQFLRLLQREEDGADPRALEARWLALNRMVWPELGRKPRVSFAVPEKISHFLDDPDVRAEDKTYAEMQRRDAWDWLRMQRGQSQRE